MAKLHAFLGFAGVAISPGQVSQLLTHNHDGFHRERQAMLQAGLASSPWQHIDTTATRVNGTNQHCHVLSNQTCAARPVDPSLARWRLRLVPVCTLKGLFMEIPLYRPDRPELSAVAAMAALAAFSTTTFPTPAATLAAAVTLARQIVGAQTVFVGDLTPGTLHIRTVETTEDGGRIAAGSTLPLETTFCQYVRATQSPMTVTDAATDSRVSAVATRQDVGIGAYLGVPILDRDGLIIGTLCAIDPAPRTFTPYHTHALQLLAAQVAPILAAQTPRPPAPVPVPPDPAVEEMTTILRMVAHDIRSPLSAVQGSLDLLLTAAYGALGPEQRTLLQSAREATQFIHRLALDLVDTAAAHAGMLSVLRGPVDLAAVVAMSIDACRLRATEKGLTVVADLDPQLPVIHADADRLQQVLLNLLSNAVRYSTSGTIRVEGTVQPTTVTLRVVDSGPGIAAQDHDRVWERQVRMSTHGRGIGLGLYIVRRLVMAMGGTVGLSSVPGQSSTFSVSLPIDGPTPHHTSMP